MITRLFYLIRYYVPTYLQLVFVTLVLVGVVYANLGVLQNSKIKQLQADIERKIYITRQLATYASRTFFYSTEYNSEVVKPISRVWANVEGMTQKGEIVIRLWGASIQGVADSSKNTTLITAELADIHILNTTQAAMLVKQFLRKQVEIDYYRYELKGELHDAIVLWLEDGQPLNQLLVDKRLATPHSLPPTNIINELMLSYYWEIL